MHGEITDIALKCPKKLNLKRNVMGEICQLYLQNTVLFRNHQNMVKICILLCNSKRMSMVIDIKDITAKNRLT